eukprot:scaffold8446_cov90-Cylindrotheca_fusiformis.AAC.7
MTLLLLIGQYRRKMNIGEGHHDRINFLKGQGFRTIEEDDVWSPKKAELQSFGAETVMVFGFCARRHIFGPFFLASGLDIQRVKDGDLFLSSEKFKKALQCDPAEHTADLDGASVNSIAEQQELHYIHTIEFHCEGDFATLKSAQSTGISDFVALPTRCAADEWKGCMAPRAAVLMVAGG